MDKDTQLRWLAYSAYQIAKLWAPYSDIQANQTIIDESSNLDQKSREINQTLITAGAEIGISVLGYFGNKIGNKASRFFRKNGIDVLRKTSSLKNGNIVKRTTGKITKGFGTVLSKAGKGLDKLTNSKADPIKLLASGNVEGALGSIGKKTLKKLATNTASNYLIPTVLNATGPKLASMAFETSLNKATSLSEEEKKALSEVVYDVSSAFFFELNENKFDNMINVSANLAKSSKHHNVEKVSNLLASVLAVPRYETFTVTEEMREKPISLNMLAKSIPELKPYIPETIGNLAITADKINDFIWYTSIYDNFLKTLRYQNKKSSGLQKLSENTSKAIQAGLNEFFKTENIVKIFNATTGEYISENDVSEIMNLLSENNDLDLSKNDDKQDESINHIEYEEEPKLIEGWSHRDLLSGLNGGDLPYIIKRVRDLEGRYVILLANLNVITPELGNSSSFSTIEFAEIRKYSKQYYEYYKNASYQEISEDALMYYRYLMYCLNGVDFSKDNFLSFYESEWSSELEELVYILFDIFTINDKLCKVSSSTSSLPDPEESTNQFIKKILSTIKEKAKEVDSEYSEEVIDTIDNVLNDLSINGLDAPVTQLDFKKDIAADDNLLTDDLVNNIESSYDTLKELDDTFRRDFVSLDNYSDNSKYIKWIFEESAKYDTPFDTLMFLVEQLDKEYTKLSKMKTNKSLGNDITDSLFNGFTMDQTISVKKKYIYNGTVYNGKHNFSGDSYCEYSNVPRLSPEDISIIDSVSGEVIQYGHEDGIVTDITKKLHIDYNDILSSGRNMNGYYWSNMEIYSNTLKDTLLSIIMYTKDLTRFIANSLFNPKFSFDNGKVSIGGSNKYNTYNLRSLNSSAYYLFDTLVQFCTSELTFLQVFYKKSAKLTVFQFTKRLRKLLSYLGYFEYYDNLLSSFSIRYEHFGYTEQIKQTYSKTWYSLMASLMDLNYKSLVPLYESVNLKLANHIKGGLVDLYQDDPKNELISKFYKTINATRDPNAKKVFEQWRLNTYETVNSFDLTFLENQVEKAKNAKSLQELFSIESDFFEKFMEYSIELTCIWALPAFAIIDAASQFQTIMAISVTGSFVSGAVEGGLKGASGGPQGAIIGAAVMGTVNACISGVEMFQAGAAVSGSQAETAMIQTINLRNQLRTTIIKAGIKEYQEGVGD